MAGWCRGTRINVEVTGLLRFSYVCFLVWELSLVAAKHKEAEGS